MADENLKAQLAAAKARAKQAEEKAKADKKARKKNATNPAEMGRFRQIIRAFQVTHEYDKALPWIMGGAFALPIVIGVVVGILTGHPIYLPILGLSIGVLLAMVVLVQRAKKATYKRYAGQAGSAEVALGMLPKQWVSTPVIAVTRQRDAVHRTVGPGGIVLIGEGEPGRLKAILAGEVKKHERVAYGVKVTTIIMGDKDGQVPLEKLADHIRKLPKVLQAHQITDVKQRLARARCGTSADPRAEGPDADEPPSDEGRQAGHAGPLSRTRLSGLVGPHRSSGARCSSRARRAARSTTEWWVRRSTWLRAIPPSPAVVAVSVATRIRPGSPAASSPRAPSRATPTVPMSSTTASTSSGDHGLTARTTGPDPGADAEPVAAPGDGRSATSVRRSPQVRAAIAPLTRTSSSSSEIRPAA